MVYCFAGSVAPQSWEEEMQPKVTPPRNESRAARALEQPEEFPQADGLVPHDRSNVVQFEASRAFSSNIERPLLKPRPWSITICYLFATASEFVTRHALQVSLAAILVLPLLWFVF